MRRTKGNLIIKERNPWKIFLWLVAATVLFVVSLMLVFEFGYGAGDKDGLQTIQNIKDHKDREKHYSEEIRRLNIKNAELSQQKAQIDSLRQIDVHAHKRIKDSLSQLQQQNQEYYQELQFYRKIIVPDKGESGIHIQDIKIHAGSSRSDYHFKVVLIQVQDSSRNRVTNGIVNIFIGGRQADGSPRELSLRELVPPDQNMNQFTIKYLATFEGKLVLPEGFTPSKIRVQVIADRKRGHKLTVEKNIQWPIRS